MAVSTIGWGTSIWGVLLFEWVTLIQSCSYPSGNAFHNKSDMITC